MAALALHEDGLRGTTLLPLEPWRHIAGDADGPLIGSGCAAEVA